MYTPPTDEIHLVFRRIEKWTFEDFRSAAMVMGLFVEGTIVRKAFLAGYALGALVLRLTFCALAYSFVTSWQSTFLWAARSQDASAQEQAIAGYWTGSIEYGEAKQQIAVKFSLSKKQYAGSIDIPDAGIVDQPLTGLDFAYPTVRFDLPLGRGTFSGTVQKDAIVGHTGNIYGDEFAITAVLKRTQQPALPYAEREVKFRSGDTILAGTVFTPRSRGPYPAVVAIHGATERTRTNPDYRFLADLLPRAGIAVLLYDGRGAGESTGDFATASFGDLAEDALAGVRELMKDPEIDPRHIGMWGISQGGWVVPKAALLSKDVAFLIVVSGVAGTASQQMNYLTAVNLRRFGFLEQDVSEMLKTRQTVDEFYRGRIGLAQAQRMVDSASGQAWFSLAYIPRRLPTDLTKSKWHYQMDFDSVPLWEHIKIPALILFGEDDEQVPVAEEVPAFKRALEIARNPDFTIIGFPGANHELLVLPHKGEPWHWRYIVPDYKKELVDWILKRCGR